MYGTGYFAAPRIVFLRDLLDVLDANYIANLNDNYMVRLLLYGDPGFPHQSNVTRAKMAMTYISETKRFTNREIH